MATAAEYWDERARRYALQGHGLAAVCSYGMPAFYNSYIDICQRRALRRWLSRAARPGSTALDVGCGVGRWSLELARRGHEVTGVDLSPRMVERATARAQDAGLTCQFATGNATTLALDRKFDVVLCVTVLQHIMEPEAAQTAVERLAAHLAPGGELVLLEAAPARAIKSCDTAAFNARTLVWYADALRRAGLRLTEHHGVDPTPLKAWLMPAYRRMPVPLRVIALALTTAISLPLDFALGRALTRFSWHAVLVARHR
ncbi:MAG TPA: methyltransferase domain-containing protein [Steroidobacteraceae bacterium]|nr:methyltransferase domain-containing protein [Steroidobacteraceae bacterium]